MQHNMAEVARLMQGVIEGSLAAPAFARTIQSRSADTEWLVALGLAMRELGGLIERTATVPFERQKALTAQSQSLALRRQEALDRVTAERDELRLLVRTLEKDTSKMRQDMDFLSMFSPPPPPVDGAASAGTSPRAKGGRFSSLVGKVSEQEREARRRAAAEDAARAAANAPSPAAQRQHRITVHSTTFKAHEKDFAARLDVVQDAHKGEISRMADRFENMRRSQQAAADAREQQTTDRRKKEERRLKEAELEADVAREREATSRAQAAAAADVLREQQLELAELRAELDRTKHQLQSALQRGGTNPPATTPEASPGALRAEAGACEKYPP